MTLLPGELWLLDPVDPPGARAVVCVLLQHKQHALVAFTDSETDLASDKDVCYALGEAAPWTVRVNCGLVGPVRASQFVERVGAIPETTRRELLTAALDGQFAPSLAPRRGLPLHGPHDTRVAEIDARLDEIWQWWFAPLTDFD